MDSIKNSKVEMMKCDLVVIGGGGSGLTAASAAAEAGVKNIIVLEKAPHLGGNTNMIEGVFAVNSTLQAQLGIKASADAIFKDIMTYTNWKTDAKIVRDFIKNSASSISWLEKKGLKFKVCTEFLSVNVSPRTFHMLEDGHRTGKTGRPIILTLTKELQDRGVTLLCRTAAKKIITDGEGKVTGVLAATKDKELNITTNSVIVTAGGFGRNKEMLEKRFPGHGDIECGSLPQLTGDGIRMVEEVGALPDDEMVILLYGPTYPGEIGINILQWRPEAVKVNKKGRRFISESVELSSWDAQAHALDKQPDKICFSLVDQSIKEIIKQKRNYYTGVERDSGFNCAWMDTMDEVLQSESMNQKGKSEVISESWSEIAMSIGGEEKLMDELQSKYVLESRVRVKIADSLDDIAAWMGADPAVLKNTIEQYNSFCDNGYDDDFLKDKEFLLPLRTPPYIAMKGTQGFDTTLGGIKVNENMEVLNRQYDPIKGLYAGGDNASGLITGSYMHRNAGLAAGYTFYSGRTAGGNAAKYLQKKQ